MSVETQQPARPDPAEARPQANGRLTRGSGRLPLLLSALVAAAVAATAVMLLTGDDAKKETGRTVSGSKQDPFEMSYPASWSSLPKTKLAKLPGRPVAVVRRKDKKGLVVVRVSPRPAPRDLRTLGADLRRQLKKGISDVQIRAAKPVKLRSGNALFLSYLRKKKGTTQTLVVVPAGKRTFTINTVSVGGANDVARQIGRMILSFDTKP